MADIGPRLVSVAGNVGLTRWWRPCLERVPLRRDRSPDGFRSAGTCGWWPVWPCRLRPTPWGRRDPRGPV